MWLLIIAAIISGLAQSVLMGLGAGYTFINLPALVVMAALRKFSAGQVAAVALVAGLSWDWLSPPLGTAALAMVIAAGLVFYIEQHWWPARGGLAIGTLVMIMVIIIKVILLLISRTSPAHLNFLKLFMEVIISGLVAGWWWRKVKVSAFKQYGR